LRRTGRGWALFGAVLLGVGAIFLPKHRPDDHWSTTPKVHVLTERSPEATGPEPGQA